MCWRCDIMPTPAVNCVLRGSNQDATYILDNSGLNNAVAAYSLRKLSATATNAIRVRDDTGSETDIGFIGKDLDTQGLTNWLNRNLLASIPLGVDTNANGISDGWNVYPPGAGVTQTNSIDGAYQKINITTDGAAFAVTRGIITTNTFIKCVEGKTVTFSVTYKFRLNSGGAGSSARIYVQFLDSAQNNISSNLLEGSSTTDATLTLTATAPANTAYVRFLLYAYCSAVNTNVDVWYKDASVTISNQTPYVVKWYDQSNPVKKFDFSNAVTNGDFSNGTTGWAADSSTVSATNNVATITGNGASAYPQIGKTTSYAIGNKIYARYYARITTTYTGTAIIGLIIAGSTGGSTTKAVIINPVVNQWYLISNVVDTATFSGNVRVILYDNYPDAATANGKVMEVQEVMAIDLTSLFGAGKEPTISECDALLSFTATTGTVYRTQPNDAIQSAMVSQPIVGNDSSGKPRIVFDGIDDYLSIASNSIVRPATGITLNAIAYNSNWSAMTDSRIISCTETGGYQLGISDPYYPGKVGSLFFRNNSYGVVSHAISNLLDKTIITSHYDGRYSKLFINNSEKHSDDAGGNYPLSYSVTVPLLIGAEPSGSGQHLYTNISINEITIYPFALSNSVQTKLEKNQSKHYRIPSQAWTPSQISTALWLDANDASTITLNGSNVSQWKDKSGNNRHASQATAVNQPAYNTTGINNKHSIIFDGVNDTLKSTANLGISGTNTFSIYAVHAFPWVSLKTAFSFGTVGRYHHMCSFNSGQYWTGYEGQTQLGTYSPATPSTAFMLGIERTGNTGSSWKVYQNGTALALTAGNNSAVNLTDGPYSVGAFIDGTLPSQTNFGELIITPSVLSISDRQKIEGYLAWKWGGL